ncbi:hypothetical protein BCR33DRAFT_367152 [Rhizoclosmatium globosum]|uniref:G-protein coupled receptors family 1 profile domain-containing protein n=1 Tax=Rhizoclosmatium globosum TaxID=329046 RepID=A0A1Y2C0E1_9FUNG|nr:hypothetical protein BCR33DRAFT_367152 [Rhizoclosmatium globosum]|eukprot:ORY40498.1 hypothetical protein BCR33DRAFT_367152 [Rhizoclosmatium globosum]
MSAPHPMSMSIDEPDPSQAFLVPAYVVSLTVNGVIGIYVLRYRRELLASTLSKIFLILVIFFVAWSAVNIGVGSAILAMNQTMLLMKIAAALNSIGAFCVFGLNMAVAVERFLVVRQASDKRIWFVLISVYVAVLVGLAVWVFATSPSSDCFQPDLPMQRTVFFGANFAAFVPMYLGVLGLYLATFVHSSRVVRQVLTNVPQKTVVRAELTRRLLISCLVMSSTMLILYTPFVVLMLSAAFMEHANLQIWMTVCNALITADAIATPLLVLYFNPRMRVLFAQSFYRGVYTEDNSSIGGSTLQGDEYEL